MKKSVKILIIAASVILIMILSTWIFVHSSLTAVTSEEKSYTVKIQVPDNTTVKEIASILKENKLIKNKDIFYLAARYPWITGIFCGQNQKLQLKSGVYNIKSSMSICDIFEALSSGQQDFIIVSIPEGLTISKIAARLEEAGVCSSSDFIKAANNTELLEKNNIKSVNFEGYLFPDTYYLTPGMNAENVVQEMADNLKNHIAEIPELTKLTAEQLNDKIKLASIIEREYRIPDEAPVISSVFTNRLKINMGLYSCATVEYIITEIEHKPHPDIITYADIESKNPYNTYKWAGLPPGAISNPGMIALTAAAKPAKTSYFYFTLVNPATGKHEFSKDLKTHVNQGYTARTK